MTVREPALNKQTLNALLALTKTRCTRSDHALRSTNTLYRLNTRLVSTHKLKAILPREVRYVIVGGVASAHYQPTRFTEKADLMVLAEDSVAVEQALEATGWHQSEVISFGGSS